MSSYVLGLHETHRAQWKRSGGKGANLGELSTIPGLHVPKGFCVTTDAYEKVVANHPELKGLLDRLAEGNVSVGARIRTILENVSIPKDITDELGVHLRRLGEDAAYAVRSSATTEDSPTASFAGQHDSYLNIKGKTAILKHIGMCWASLFSERALSYRLQKGLDPRDVQLAVVVQTMVSAQKSGIMFTADPVTGHRKVMVVDAGLGLGDALVSGLVNPDHYKVRDGQVMEQTIATQGEGVLTKAQLVQLERIGRTIEAHFGGPQDIEWCWADDKFYVVQSRPITTLFPLPETRDSEKHVYISVGHQQMMTDPMKPLGLSFFQLTAGRPMVQAGGRLFVDIAGFLATSAGRKGIMDALGQADPLIKDALLTILNRGDFIETPPDAATESESKLITSIGYRTQVENDPQLVVQFIQRSQANLLELQEVIDGKSGRDLLDFIKDDIGQFRKALCDAKSLDVILAAMDASYWINDKMKEWLGEKNVADTISQSVPHNVTSEMGLALLDAADVVRPYPQVIAFLETVKEELSWDDLARLPGGQEVTKAIQDFLALYGMRCVGEIDITRPRWSEKPATLVPVILGHIKNFEPGAGTRKFEQGKQEALKKEREILEKLKSLPDGEAKAEETKRMIDLVRNYSGYREYPKYGIVSRYFIYKKALLKEAEQLVRLGVFQKMGDIEYLSMEELQNVVSTQACDPAILRAREEAFHFHKKLTPPRVMTSDGEMFNGTFKPENLPAGAIPGLPVSQGIIEGRARVILTLEDADLQDGDILVTKFTDPSWTPLFVSIKGLVTEVGGMMTHGAVIAREYGLPAVVSVERATQRIQDGQRIRVNGTDGYIELL